MSDRTARFGADRGGQRPETGNAAGGRHGTPGPAAEAPTSTGRPGRRRAADSATDHGARTLSGSGASWSGNRQADGRHSAPDTQDDVVDSADWLGSPEDDGLDNGLDNGAGSGTVREARAAVGVADDAEEPGEPRGAEAGRAANASGRTADLEPGRSADEQRRRPPTDADGDARPDDGAHPDRGANGEVNGPPPGPRSNPLAERSVSELSFAELLAGALAAYRET